MLRLPRCIAAAALLCGSLAHPDPSATQESYNRGAPTFSTSRVISLGYIVNAPNAYIGGGAAFLNPTFLGAFADFRMSGSSPADASNFDPRWTVREVQNEFNDFLQTTEDAWVVVNAGLTRVVGPELAIYGGAGYARRRAFAQFEDSSGERGEFGYYWAEDDEISGGYVNVLGGVFFRAGRNLMFQFGAESQPRGMTVGVHYALPLR